MRTAGQLSNAELEFLASFFGPEGSHFEAIRDYEGVDLGTKVLYLERAIGENDCASFLKFLDKLYRPAGNAVADRLQIEFISALKLINDICFNNPVKYTYGPLQFLTSEEKLTITHYFSKLRDSSNPTNPITFRNAITGMVISRVEELTKDYSAEIQSEQISTRKNAERLILRQTEWRDRLDLLDRQRVGPIRASEILEVLKEMGIKNLGAQGIDTTSSPILEALYFLITDHHVTVDAAVAELSHLDGVKADALKKLYANGLRGNHLRKFKNFTVEHKEALLNLVEIESFLSELAINSICSFSGADASILKLALSRSTTMTKKILLHVVCNEKFTVADAVAEIDTLNFDQKYDFDELSYKGIFLSPSHLKKFQRGMTYEQRETLALLVKNSGLDIDTGIAVLKLQEWFKISSADLLNVESSPLKNLLSTYKETLQLESKNSLQPIIRQLWKETRTHNVADSSFFCRNCRQISHAEKTYRRIQKIYHKKNVSITDRVLSVLSLILHLTQAERENSFSLALNKQFNLKLITPRATEDLEDLIPTRMLNI